MRMRTSLSDGGRGKFYRRPFFCFLLKIKLFSSILISRWLRIDSVIDKDLFTCLSPEEAFFFFFLSLPATINYRSSIYVAEQPAAQLVL